MAWTCYSCGVKNPRSADVCQKCGGSVAAPANFYAQWIFGGAVFFLVFYVTGTFAGGVLIESVAVPENSAILAEINAARKADVPEYKSLETAEPEALTAAKAVVSEKNKAKMSGLLKGVLYWCFPVVLFVLCGIIVGFISDGKTILEPCIGSILGQAGGVALHVYVFDSELTWMALAIGVVPGFGLAALGAWLGEIIQDRRERAGGITA
jgi:hypothetical protein